jgi:hypothetical protein
MTSTQEVLIYELIVLSIIVSASYLLPNIHGFQHLNLTLGGLLMGCAQAASLLLGWSPVGVSTAYERIGLHMLIDRTVTKQ